MILACSFVLLTLLQIFPRVARASVGFLSIMAQEMLLHPAVVWAQRKDVIFLTIRLEDTTNPDIKLKPDKMTFRAIGGHDQKEYGFEFIFHGDIIPEESKQHITKRELAFVLKKKDETASYWPRLLNTTVKVPFLKTDFDKWKDEDDSDDDADNVNQNFEEMMKQMGDTPGTGVGGGAFGGDEADSDDSDDGDMPGLE